jgi:hypothetical protein
MRVPLSRLLLAWGFNLSLVVAMHLLLVYVLISRSVLPQELQASALEESEWLSRLCRAFGASMLASFVLVDGSKVLLLTLTNTPSIDRALSRTKRKKRFVRTPLRRLHRLLDVLL